MIIKISEATPLQINYLVAKCEGHESRCQWMLEQQGYTAWQSYERAWGSPIPDYSTDWVCGGPIIEREINKLFCNVSNTWTAQIKVPYKYYSPTYSIDIDTTKTITLAGQTPLLAAMRCYVVSKLGDEVEVLDELCYQ